MSDGEVDLVFRVLGPVEVVASPTVLRSLQHQHRALLALLLLNAGRLVTVEQVVDGLWGARPPATAVAQVYNQVSVIRAVLRDASGAGRLERQPAGYVLRLTDGRLDLAVFDRLVSRAQATATPDARAGLLRDAVALWRGRALAGVDAPYAEAARAELDERYAAAVGARFEIELELGRHGAIVAELAAEVARRPLREQLAGQLMLALHGAGRTSEAVAVYDRTRRTLADEAGLDPGAELQELHKRILRGTSTPVATGGRSVPAVPRPAQLPADLAWFTGRAVELDRVLSLASDQVRPRAAVVISAIDGMAGIGKTTLAVHAAHRIAEHYPDGQLFVDLHGYTQGVEPVEPAEALDHLLRALGIPGTQIPTSLDQRAALYRSRLAGQQMLIVLDNAATETQVQPLLPGSPGCLVLVTSRRRLAGLDHAHTLSLDTLPTPDAVTLLRHAAGEDRLVGQPPELLTELVEVCGRLPLAIRIAAARLRSHPTWQLADLVGRLRDQQHRLDELVAGHRSVTAALDLSYQHLSPDQQQTYRLLGLHPGPDLDPYAVAALLDSNLRHAGRVLDQLLEAHLLQEPTPGRYRFHDLTRAHAAHTAGGEQTAASSDAALGRLLDYYRHTASVATDTAYPYEREHRPQVPPVHTPGPEVPDQAAAIAWLDTELPNLLAAARYATEHSRPGHILHLSVTLHRHLHTRGRYHDAETLHQQALTTAGAVSDQAGQLYALNGLGDIRRLQGRYGQAADHLGQALQIARTIDNHPGELNALNGLGHIHRQQGRYGQAADHYQQALQIARVIGHRPGEQDALNGFGEVRRLQARYEQAVDHYQQALRIARVIGHRPGELNALVGLGHILRQQGRYGQAADHLGQALQIARTIDNHPGELNALVGLGHIHRQQGRHGQAADHYQQALQIARVIGHGPGELNALSGLGRIHRQQGRYGQAADHYRQLLELAQESSDHNYEFEAWQGLGWLSHATGHPDAAIAHHERALTLAGELSQPDDQARAHDGLAHAHHALNQHEQAHQHWQHALNLLTSLGIDDTDDEETTTVAIRARLADVEPQDDPPSRRRYPPPRSG